MRAIADAVSFTSWPQSRNVRTSPPWSRTSPIVSTSIPPDPQAGSWIVSPGCGSSSVTSNRTTARGVKSSPAFLPDSSANWRSRYS